MAINLVEKYLQQVDELFKNESKRSVEERVTEYIEKKEAERRERIEQRRREDEALLEKALERFKCVK